MRFLVDAQLSSSLCGIIESSGHQSLHTQNLPRGNLMTDSQILEFCNQGDWILITKDTDFFFSHILYHSPAKLLIIRTGNLRLRRLINLFTHYFPQILEKLQSHSLIELHDDQFHFS